jgi:vacuolar protein sorting-associated protein 13A/C
LKHVSGAFISNLLFDQSDFVLEPVKGLQRSVQEMDASYLVDGVARGTLSLARHTVGGFADSAAMIAETFSKNMAVLTLDRRYAQKRDRREYLRDQDDINVALGIGSGVQKVVKGFLDGVTGVVKAPIRGAEKRGLEGFAKVC